MNNKNEDIKETMAKAVVSITSTARGKKSTGVVIAKITKDIAIITIDPFSL